MVVSALSGITIFSFILACLTLLFTLIHRLAKSIKDNNEHKEHVRKLRNMFGLVVCVLVVIKALVFAFML